MSHYPLGATGSSRISGCPSGHQGTTGVRGMEYDEHDEHDEHVDELNGLYKKFNIFTLSFWKVYGKLIINDSLFLHVKRLRCLLTSHNYIMNVNKMGVYRCDRCNHYKTKENAITYNREKNINKILK